MEHPDIQPSDLPPAPVETPPVVSPPQDVHVFWRRFFAFVVDSLLLGVIGLILGTMMFDFLARLGDWGRLIGFVIALAYLGIMNSSIAGGQTLGKRLLGIRVVSRQGTAISPATSFLRALVLLPPYFLNELQTGVAPHMIVATILTLIVFGAGGITLYLMIFNKGTRQGLHDLVAGTYVVRTGSSAEVAVQRVSRKHWVACAAIVLLAVGTLVWAARSVSSPGLFQDLLAIQAKVAATPSVRSVGVVKNWTTRLGGENFTSLTVRAAYSYEPDTNDMDEIAKTVLRTSPTALNCDQMTVVVSYGYDIGIAHAWRSRNATYTIAGWKERLKLP